MTGDVELLRHMLEIYSPSMAEDELAACLVEQMQARGFRAYRDQAGNAVGELGHGEREIMLLGHMDTVPGFIPVRVENDELYGRGAVDAKGPLAAFISAMTRAGPLPGKRLVVVGAVEEEAATSKGARHVLERFAPDHVIVGEPGRWDRITLGYKGRLLIDYRLEREVGHSAGRINGVCEEAAAFWERLRDHAAEYNRHKDKMFLTLDPSLRRLHSESDGLTESVEATIGLRLPPDLDVELLRETIVEMAGAEAELSFYACEAPFRAEKNTALSRAFLAAIREAGGRPAFKVKTGTSDMNVVGPVWGCPIVAYGPGDSSLDHTPHEHVSLAEYHKAIGVLESVLKSL